MSPFPHEMAKSFVRGWQGSSSVGWSGSCSARVQSTGVSPALEGSSHKTPGNTFFQRKKAPKCWMQQTTKGMTFSSPWQFLGQPFPLWFLSPAPAEQTVRGLAQSRGI